MVEAVKDDPKMLKRLITPLVGIEFEKQKEKLLTSKEISSPSLRKEKQQKIDFARDLLLKHAFNKLNPEDQKEMIQKDLELAAYASPDIKKDFILASKKQLDNLLNESGANTSMLTADSDEVQKAIELFMSINKLMEQILVLNINSKSIISRDKLQEALREELKKCHNIDLLNQTIHSFKNTLSELIEVTNEYQQFKLELEISFGLKKTNRIFEEIDKKVMNGDSLLVRHNNLLQQRQVINFDELRSKKLWIDLRMTTIIDIKIDDKSPIDLKLLLEEESIRIQTASSLDEFWDVLNKWEKNLQNVKEALNLYQLNKKN